MGFAPIFKVNGELLAHGNEALTTEDISALIQASIPARQFEGYVSTNDANYAIELMLATLLMQEYIRAGYVEKITKLIKRSAEYGMQSIDQAIIALFKQSVISAERALKAAESESNVRLAIKLDSPVGRTSGRQAFDVEATTGTSVDKWWQDLQLSRFSQLSRIIAAARSSIGCFTKSPLWPDSFARDFASLELNRSS